MSKKEELLALIEGFYRSETNGFKITVGFLKTDGTIISMDYDKDDQYVFISQVKGIFDEKDGELINKLTGTKIIGVKDYDGIPYTDKRFKENAEKVKTLDKIHDKIEEKPIQTRTKRPVVSELFNDKGEVIYDKPIETIQKKEGE